MKNFYFLAIFFISVIVNAQFTKVLEFNDSKLLPQYEQKHRMKVWKNKVFYQGKGIPASFPYHYRTCNLVVSDGTAEGTKILKDLSPSTEYDAKIVQWAATDSYLYFTCKTNYGKYQLWRTDGTSENTLKLDESFRTGFTEPNMNYLGIGGTTSEEFITSIQNSSYNYPDNFDNQPVTIGNKLFYTKFDNTTQEFSMYETEGTVESIKKIPGDYSYKQSLPNDYLVYNNKLYFGGSYYTVNQYSGVKSRYDASFVYDGVSTKQVFYSNNIFEPSFTRFSAVFNGKMYFDAGNFNIYSTTDFGNNKKLVYTAPCTMGFPGPPDSKKTFQFRKTANYMFMFGNNGCDEYLYTIDKNDAVRKVLLPPNSKLKEIITGENISYIHTETLMNSAYSYNITAINEDASLINSVTVNYPFFWGHTLNGILYYADLPEKLNSPTLNGLNIELWRTNGSSNYMAYEINRGQQQLPQNNFVNMPSQPRNFFKLQNKIYFIATNEGKENLYSLNEDFTFNNGTSNNQWNEGDNWAGQIVPFESDDALIPAGKTPEINGNASVKNISVSSPLNLSAGTLNISGNLDLGAKITLNNNNLNLKGNSSQITNGNASNYIVTNGTGTVNVENLNSARGTVNLPIGTATNYNPVSIANTGTSDTFSARVSDGISNTTNGAVNATWDISEATAGGSNVNLTLGWNASQQNGSFDASTAKVGHYLNGNWTEENSGTVSNNSITATGISSFSPFAVMNFGTLAATDFSKSKVSVYPNPFNENLNISTENGGVVNFYDLSGKLVATSVLMKGTNSLNKSSLTKGVYIYQIKNTRGEVVSSGKVIKK